jgi:hypothetical protein
LQQRRNTSILGTKIHQVSVLDYKGPTLDPIETSMRIIEKRPNMFEAYDENAFRQDTAGGLLRISFVLLAKPTSSTIPYRREFTGGGGCRPRPQQPLTCLALPLQLFRCDRQRRGREQRMNEIIRTASRAIVRESMQPLRESSAASLRFDGHACLYLCLCLCVCARVRVCV